MMKSALLLLTLCINVYKAGGSSPAMPLKCVSCLSQLEDHGDLVVPEEPFVHSLSDGHSYSSLGWNPATLHESPAVSPDHPNRDGSYPSEASFTKSRRASRAAAWSLGRLRRLSSSAPGSSSSGPDDASLARLLVTIVNMEMKDCVLVVAYDYGFRDSAALEQLTLLPNPRQVVAVTSADDLRGIVWEAAQCRGYLLLLQQPRPLLTFASYGDYLWDFRSRYVVVGLTKSDILALSHTRKVAKTENLVAIVKQSERRGEWRLYTSQVVWSATLTHVATWRSGRFTADPDLYPDKLADLHGAVLTVVTFQWEPGVLYRRDPRHGSRLRYGRDIQVVTALGHALNFSLQYIETPPGEVWGTRVGNGSSWNGMLGYMQRAEADIGAANVFITNINNRLEVADFSTPYDADMSCFLARQPPPLPRWQRIIYPFQMETWLALLVGIVVSGPVLQGLARAGHACGGESRDLLSLHSSWLYTLGLHTSEAQAAVPRRRSTQVFVSFLWLYTIIVTTAYRSNLTAFLTVARQPPTIDTIPQLYASDIQVSGVGDFFGKALKSSENPYLKECFAPYGIGLVTQRSSPLKTKFDPLLLRMVESGLVQQWFSESLRVSKNDAKMRQEQQGSVPGPASDEEEDPVEGDSGGRSISLDHMQGVFFILLMGNILSILTFVVEMTVGSRPRCRGGP
ncbi:ionotropic receptor 21a-like isoform X2 [Panulirus ornatus]|uniref:ionotropic receptor 21a-like isoform X2 n=1 Tax=Panulirus ornatus TaxID=150431 RepID=UPI003A8521F9